MSTISKDASALASLAEAYWQQNLHDFPYIGFEHGHPDSSSTLMRESMNDYAQRTRARKQFEHRLSQLNAQDLHGQDRLTYGMLARQFRLDAQLEELEDHLRPNIFPFGPEGLGPMVAAQTALHGVKDANSYLERLRSLPRSLEEIVERLRVGVAHGHSLPTVLLDRVIGNIKAHIAREPAESAWMAPFKSLPADSKDAAALRDSALLFLRQGLYPAYIEYERSISRLYAGGTDSIACRDTPNGEAYYRCLIEKHTSLTLSPEEIHQIGLDELASISKRMQRVADTSGFDGSVSRLRDHLQSDPSFILASPKALKERMEVLSKRIDRLVPEFFGTVPRSTYGVESIGLELSAQMPPAYAQPAPANRTSSGIHWITSLPARCPTYMHVPLALHEAWPGHLMHIALLEEIADLPNFRRFGALNYTSYIEGWALYCEGLGEEMGLYEDPFDLFGRLSMDAWRAARLVIDTGIHWMGWSREKSIAFLLEHNAMPPEAAAAEVDRYIGMPGQALAYKLGQLAISRLRATAQKSFGESFVLRDFHDRLVAAGPVTLPVLDEFVTQWIEAGSTHFEGVAA